MPRWAARGELGGGMMAALGLSATFHQKSPPSLIPCCPQTGLLNCQEQNSPLTQSKTERVPRATTAVGRSPRAGRAQRPW